MILTVTINPLLERRLYFESIKLGDSNKAVKENYTAGGKGINVSRQLNHLYAKNLAYTFIGGYNGKTYRRILEDEKINYSAVSTRADMRTATLAVNEGLVQLTTYFGLNPEITSKESSEFIDKLYKIIANASMVIFSGSSPNSNTDEIFPAGIKMALKHDKIAILDTYGSHLRDCLKQKPFAIHNNMGEIESSLNIKLRDEKDTLEFINTTYSQGVKIILLTDGSRPFIVSNFGFHYRISVPRIKLIDATGSGDSFVAGYAYGVSRAMVFEDSIRLASALGARNAASWETCCVNLEEAYPILDKIKISNVGKKMKMIDDSPNY